MPHFETDYAHRKSAAAIPLPTLWALMQRANRLWLLGGVALLLLAPSLATLRGPFGWWPYWLVLAPATNLAVAAAYRRFPRRMP